MAQEPAFHTLFAVIIIMTHRTVLLCHTLLLKHVGPDMRNISRTYRNRRFFQLLRTSGSGSSPKQIFDQVSSGNFLWKCALKSIFIIKKVKQKRFQKYFLLLDTPKRLILGHLRPGSGSGPRRPDPQHWFEYRGI
jgi:hypothetical protein